MTMIPQAVSLLFLLTLATRVVAQDVSPVSRLPGSPPISICTPPGYDREALLELKRNRFAISDDARRNSLALALAGCLGDPDPLIRDGIAYEALTHFLRGRQLTPATVEALRARLLVDLRGPEGAGFIRPFVALVLAELARADWVAPYLSTADRAELVAAATDYVRGITDYRAFDEREGYRHGVAHGADFLMQLAFNPQVSHDDVWRILDAVESQLLPPAHVYRAGESERLAGPVLAAARRGVLTTMEWTSWLARVVVPAKQSPSGSANRQNASAFLLYLHRITTGDSASVFAALRPGVEAARIGLP